MSSSEEGTDNNDEIENGHISLSSGSSFSLHLEDDSSDNDEEGEQTPSSGDFNPELPVAHRYLGKLSNKSQYIVYEDGEEIEILSIKTNTMVFPGYTLPLVINDNHEISLCMKYMTKSLSIALIPSTTQQERHLHGVILEIYGSQTKNGALNLKARGRQRCMFLCKRPVRPLFGRFMMLWVKVIGDPPVVSPLARTQMLTLKSKRKFTSIDWDEYRTLKKYRRYHLAQYTFPSFIYDTYEIGYYFNTLFTRLSTYIHSDWLPRDPTNLGYWFAQNFQLQHKERIRMLELASTIDRLKWALRCLDKTRKLNCISCDVELCDLKYLFPMSKDGVQSNYVNPGGHVFETVTVTEAKNFRLVGSPSKDFSWFPGYWWTIMQCAYCTSHLGWKFSSPLLKPDFFYGLASSGFKVEIVDSGNDPVRQELEELRRLGQKVSVGSDLLD